VPKFHDLHGILSIFSQDNLSFAGKKTAVPPKSKPPKKTRKKEKIHAFAWFLFQKHIPFLPFAAAPFIAGENQIIQIRGNREAGFYHKSTSFPIVRKKYSMSNFFAQGVFADFYSFLLKVCQFYHRPVVFLQPCRTSAQASAK
jgi:hypothetical protein